MGHGRQLSEWGAGTRGFITRFSLLSYKLGIFQIKSQNKQTEWFAASYFLLLFSCSLSKMANISVFFQWLKCHLVWRTPSLMTSATSRLLSPDCCGPWALRGLSVLSVALQSFPQCLFLLLGFSFTRAGIIFVTPTANTLLTKPLLNKWCLSTVIQKEQKSLLCVTVVIKAPCFWTKGYH